MLSQKLLAEINNVWAQQSDDEYAFLTAVVICKELGEILKSEGFDFEFNPNTFNEYEDSNYYNIPIIVQELDNLIKFIYE